MHEEFRPAFGLESHYEVSNRGNIRRIVGGKGARLFRNFSPPSTGYHNARICIDGKPRSVSVHRLVVQTFIREMIEGECVNHIDGNKLNNAVRNLEITTPSGNALHAVRELGWKPTAQRGEANGCALLTESDVARIRATPRGYGTLQRIADELGVKLSTVYAVRAHRNWAHV